MPQAETAQQEACARFEQVNNEVDDEFLCLCRSKSTYRADVLLLIKEYISMLICVPQISETARDDLKTLRVRRVASFQKSLTELAELEVRQFTIAFNIQTFCPDMTRISFQVKHSRAHAQMLRSAIAALKTEL